MIRTQIYLTEKERKGLMDLAGEQKKKMSELIREAIDLFLEQRQTNGKTETLKQLAGLWSTRTDMPNLNVLRKQCNRLGGK